MAEMKSRKARKPKVTPAPEETVGDPTTKASTTQHKATEESPLVVFSARISPRNRQAIRRAAFEQERPIQEIVDEIFDAHFGH